MFKLKDHLFFDLDHTLWDYESCSNESLGELWQGYHLGDKGLALESFLLKFEEVNNRLWQQFHAGEIGKDVIRNDRFPAIFNELSFDGNNIATQLQQDYILLCPTKPYLIEGAREVLEALSGRYSLHIITNGFEEIQDIKLRSAGIDHFFAEVITSGLAGHQKPNREIFDYALKKANARSENSLMIGDNPLSDIEGAYLAGIDQVFYNPNNQSCPITPTLEIRALRELLIYT